MRLRVDTNQRTPGGVQRANAYLRNQLRDRHNQEIEVQKETELFKQHLWGGRTRETGYEKGMKWL